MRGCTFCDVPYAYSKLEHDEPINEYDVLNKLGNLQDRHTPDNNGAYLGNNCRIPYSQDDSNTELHTLLKIRGEHIPSNSKTIDQWYDKHLGPFYFSDPETLARLKTCPIAVPIFGAIFIWRPEIAFQ